MHSLGNSQVDKEWGRRRKLGRERERVLANRHGMMGRISMQILHTIRRLTALFDYESAASMNNSVEARGLAILVFRLLAVEKSSFWMLLDFYLTNCDHSS